ncbi:hypothetical protein KIS1582_2695 [Cytobacillus firmus]|uniref:Uncharacterized protein n=1 Tax=Cytobacillus firmus TaxID=1399 RepID=A0A800MW78_CYTFI|nr:hypothetical protein KIS1582_2695 [Cytobacillus firmus]
MTFRRKEGKLSEWVLSDMQKEKEQQRIFLYCRTLFFY